MPFAISAASNSSPTFGLPGLQPYHSSTRKSEPREKLRVSPFAMTALVPSDSAHHPTLKGLDDPQSNDRSIRHDDGMVNGAKT